MSNNNSNNNVLSPQHILCWNCLSSFSNAEKFRKLRRLNIGENFSLEEEVILLLMHMDDKVVSTESFSIMQAEAREWNFYEYGTMFIFKIKQHYWFTTGSS